MFVVILFFATIVRDIAKVIIKEERHNLLITHSVIKAIKNTLSLRFVSLSLINLFFLVLGFLLYFLLKKVVSMTVLLIVISQVFFVYRLVYRFVRLASFNYLYIETKDFPHFDIQSSDDRT